MRSGLFRKADEIPQTVEAWLEEVDEWVQEWEQFGQERRDIEDILLDFRSELIFYKEATQEYHDELHVQVLRANLFFDALYQWYEDLVFNENYLIPFLEELELAIIDNNIHVGELWAWGRNDSGQVGDGTTKDRCSPVKIINSMKLPDET